MATGRVEAGRPCQVRHRGAVAVPSITEALQRRAWVTEALCARPPNDSLPWIRERSNGRETPASVLACLEVCARCPVRIECLTDTVGETAITITGTFGGTTTSDRTAAVPEAHRSYKRDLPAYHHLTDRDEREIRTRAAAALEASFGERLEDWRRKAQVATSGPPLRLQRRDLRVRVPALRESARLVAAIRRPVLLPGCRQASYRLRLA